VTGGEGGAAMPPYKQVKASAGPALAEAPKRACEGRGASMAMRAGEMRAEGKAAAKRGGIEKRGVKAAGHAAMPTGAKETGKAGMAGKEGVA